MHGRRGSRPLRPDPDQTMLRPVSDEPKIQLLSLRLCVSAVISALLARRFLLAHALLYSDNRMRNRPYRLGALTLVAALLAGCGVLGKGSVQPEVVLSGDSAGLGVQLNMLIDVTGSDVLGAKPVEVVTLTKPSEDLNPMTFFSRGEFGVVLEQKDNQVTESTTYGSYYYENVKSADGERTIAVFARQGEEKAYGAAGSELWRVGKGEKTQIGEEIFQKVTTPDGVTRTITMTRLKGAGNKYTAGVGGKIMQLDANGKLVQAGWVGWRKVTTPEGKKLAVLMTKSMDRNARWAGRYGGKLYRDK